MVLLLFVPLSPASFVCMCHDSLELSPTVGGGDDEALRSARLDAEEERAARVAAALLLPCAAHFYVLFRV